MASVFTRKGKLMLAVLNDTDSEQRVVLALDLEKLKVKNGLKGQDAWDKTENYILSKNLTCKLPPRGFRFILFK